MRFCPQCGVPVMTGAKFCVECGSALSGTVSVARESGYFGGSAFRGRNIPITTAFLIVFLAITVVGLGAAVAVDRVLIRWPSGAISTLERPVVGRTHEVVEPRGGP